MQIFIPKEEFDATLVADVKKQMLEKLRSDLNNPNAEICDFIECDSFVNATERTIVALTDSRPVPKESLVLRTALPADLYAKMLAQLKN